MLPVLLKHLPLDPHPLILPQTYYLWPHQPGRSLFAEVLLPRALCVVGGPRSGGLGGFPWLGGLGGGGVEGVWSGGLGGSMD